MRKDSMNWTRVLLLAFLAFMVFVTLVESRRRDRGSGSDRLTRRNHRNNRKMSERRLFRRIQRRYQLDFDDEISPIIRNSGGKRRNKSLQRILNEMTRKGLRKRKQATADKKAEKKVSRKHLKALLPNSFDRKKKGRPNIVLIMTDDQDVELGSLQFMPKLNRYLREEGAYFENGFVTTPMCCPSRSSMLTGLYVHNHQVLTNNDNCSSTEWVRRHEPRTFAAYLDEAGYQTGFFGKYLNKYAGNHIPQGWDHWSGLVRNSRFYNYTVNVNGKKVRHDDDYAKDYFPDLITNSSLEFFRESKAKDPDTPVMMVMSYPGPHGPEDAAPQYKDLFFNVTTHHTPAYDYAPNPDKQWILQVTERMEPVHKKFTDLLMTKRLQTLQSIDEGIEKLYKDLESIGELENTYIFYTSDHGYHLGQFGLVKGKAYPFDLDIKVPFFVRGPGFQRGVQMKEPVLNIDLAPTFLDIAGIPKPPHMDGKSIMETVNSKLKTKWRDSFLVERGKMTQIRYEKIHHLSNNEIPLPNFHGKENAVARIFDEHVTKQNRLAIECVKNKYKSCGPYQKHKCVRKKGEWKIKKCRNSLSVLPSPPPMPTCHCQPGNKFGWREPLIGSPASENSSEAAQEWRLQRNFLKKHTVPKDSNRKRRGHKFLKNLAPGLRQKRKRNNHHLGRGKRDLEAALESIADEMVDDVTDVKDKVEEELGLKEEVEQPVQEALEEIAEEEITEVDIIMEDISEEISDLEQSMNITHTPSHRPVEELKCRFVDEENKVNCSSKIFRSRDSWTKSRSLINEQIRRLQAQLFELKEIRKHLRAKRPRHDNRTQVALLENPTNDDVVEASTVISVIPANAIQCKCSDKSSRQRQRARARRERIKLARLRRRLRRKERRQREKSRKIKKESKKHKARNCNLQKDENLNCFSHDNDHWKTAPFWNQGKFCACTNSNTNTYWCVRTVNITHNYLYCEFVSGIITYYDLTVDPYQLRNIYQTLSDSELNYMHQQLFELKGYSGYNDFKDGDRLKRRLEGKHHQRQAKKHHQNARKHQKSFSKKFAGQYLPSLEDYHFRRRHRQHRNQQFRRRK